MRYDPRQKAAGLAIAALLLALSAGAKAQVLLAGSGIAGFSGDGGDALSAQLNQPQAVVEDSAGNYYIADAGNRRVRIVSSSGRIDTLAGTGETGFVGDYGTLNGIVAPIVFPTGLALDSTGDLLIADSEGGRLLRLDPYAKVSSLIGNGDEDAAVVGRAAGDSSVLYPAGVFASGADIVFSEMGTGRILKIAADGTLALVADGFDAPYGIAKDADGALLVADYVGTVSRWANGARTDLFSADSLVAPGDDFPTNPSLPSSIAYGRDGSLYVAAPDAGAVYRIASDGTLSTLLASPQVTRPIGLFVTAASRLLVADEALNQILSVDLPYPAPLAGDADSDGRVTVQDAILGLKSLVGAVPFDRRRFLALDVVSASGGTGRDGRVTIQDVVAVLRLAVGLTN